MFLINYNSSFTSSVLLFGLSLISEASDLGAEAGFWILKGIEACFLRNL